MADRSISIAIEAKVQGFVAGLKTAQQATRDFSNRTLAFAKENEDSFDRVGKASAIFGGSIVAGIGLAVKSFADFDSRMAQIRSLSGATAGEMKALSTAALNIGQNFGQSANDVADAQIELVKAGVSVKEMLGGALQGSLALAAAGQIEVGKATEIATVALTQFKLEGSDIPHVADVLAAGADKALGGVDDLGEALKQGGLVAASYHLTLDDTVGTLSAFAKAGLLGSDAGTSLKTMLLALANPSKQAQEALDQYNITAFDSQKNFVGITDLAGQLQAKLGGLSDAEQKAALATIFGTDAIRSANVLMKEGSTGIQGWIKDVNDQGFAAKQAAGKLDSLSGDLKKLQAAFGSGLIEMGSATDGFLRPLVQNVTGAVKAFNDLPEPVKGSALAFAGVAGAGALVVGAALTLIPKISDTVAAFDKLAPAGSRARDSLKGVGKAAGIAAALAVVAQIANQIGKSFETKAASVETFTQKLLEVSQSGKSAGDVLNKDLFKSSNGRAFVEDINGVGDAVRQLVRKDTIDDINDFGNSLLGIVGLNKSTQLDKTRESLRNMDDSLVNLTSSGSIKGAQDGFKKIAAEAEKQGISVEETAKTFPGYLDALRQQAEQSKVWLTDQELLNFAVGEIPAKMIAAQTSTEGQAKATEQAAQMTDGLKQHLEDLGINLQGRITDLDKFTQSLFAAGLMSLSSSDAAIAYQDAIDKVSASAIQNGQTLDINTEAGRANQSALNDLAKAGIASMEAMAKETDANGKHVYSQAQLQGSLRTTYDDLVASAGQFGIVGDEADTLARKALGIPKKANIDSWMSDKARAEAEKTKAALDKVDGRTVNVYTNTHETTIQKVIRELSGEPAPKAPVGVLREDPTKVTKAAGGPVFGPGTGTSDDIPAMLSNGEHVLTAAEVVKMGGHAAVERMRALAKAGMLPKFATGGAAGHLGESANARANRLYREAQKRAAELKKSAQYRIEQMNDLRLDDARGQSYLTVDDSLSSAYGFSDRLRSVANSGNVPSQRGALMQRANWSDQMLRSMHAQSERLSKSLEAAKGRLEDLTQVRDRIKGDLAGGFSIGDAVKRGNMYGSASMADIQGSASGYLSRVQSFAGKLKALQKKGYSGAIVQEIAEMGLVEGAKAADVLLKATAGDVKQLNKTKGAIDTAAGQAGTYVTESMFKGGVAGASAVVKGIESQQGAIGKAMLQIGLGMENALRAALGSKPIKRAGGGAVYGPGTATSDEVPALLSNGEHVLTADEVERMGGQAGVYKFRQHLAGGYRYSPAHAPRINVPQQATAGSGGQTFGDVHITQQSDPVATYHEFSRRTRRLST